jgi:DNA-binding HxlR family transcriptional regulator
MVKNYSRYYECPTEFALEVLGGKWKTVILAYLGEQPMRYSELRRLVPKLSDKVLTERLHDLVGAGLIVRQKSRSGAGADVYALSDRSKSLSPVLRRLYVWGKKHAKGFGVDVGAPLRRMAKRGATELADLIPNSGGSRGSSRKRKAPLR